MIINTTPHAVHIVDEAGKILKTYEKQIIVRLTVKTVRHDELDGIPTSKTVFGNTEGLPEYQEGVFYIVSQMVKSALPDRVDLLVPAEVIRDKEGNILGCQSFGV